jgi:hypothetical protein
MHRPDTAQEIKTLGPTETQVEVALPCLPMPLRSTLVWSHVLLSPTRDCQRIASRVHPHQASAGQPAVPPHVTGAPPPWPTSPPPEGDKSRRKRRCPARPRSLQTQQLYSHPAAERPRLALGPCTQSRKRHPIPQQRARTQADQAGTVAPRTRCRRALPSRGIRRFRQMASPSALGPAGPRPGWQKICGLQQLP